MDKNHKVAIVEVFESVQGEGKSLGIPSIFVRFFGCNLRCQFKGKNCDTPYAVLKKDDKCKYYNVEELYNVINKIYEKNWTHRIIFTGGEPLMYQSFILDFIKYVRKVKPKTYMFEVETNGTIPIISPLNWYIDTFNVSIKLKSSNQEKSFDKRRINYVALKSYPTIKTNYKFVISNLKQDEKEIDKILENVLPNCVYLMPQGLTRKEIVKNSPEVVEMCIRNGFHFSPREHIIIWDKKRGV